MTSSMPTYIENTNASLPLETGIMEVTCVLMPLQPFCKVAYVLGAIFASFHSLHVPPPL